ncbi:MAG: dihydroorotate dehydrogenase-like protein [Candidatus Rifleibacteriota bacterium]
MADLKTRFFGLELKNPIIVASSGLTAKPQNIKEFSDLGAGAIVLKSVFEEEVINEYNQIAQSKTSSHFEEFIDYFDYKIRDQILANYGKLIKDAKSCSKVPIIASINCVSAGDWLQFASQVQDAGADAIELNLMILPSDLERNAESNRRFYVEAVKEVVKAVRVPVTAKISSYFSDLACMCKELSDEGIAGITMFNRFSTPDIDIEREKVVPAGALSTVDEHLMPLRWIGLLSSKIKCDIAASSGIHEGKQAIKMLLAGASAVQVASTLYKNGNSYLGEMIKSLEQWMQKKGYKSISDFKGKLSLEKVANPAIYERAQFLSHFGGYNENQ